jgi:NAD(P)-dependent dehydrogenase (short-subunit alcohol dehydrogenase family)
MPWWLILLIAGMSFLVLLIILLAVLSWAFYPKPLTFSGKHVLVTGGSKGLGREWAVQSAREGVRCISLIGRDKVQLQAALEEVQRVAPEAVVSAFTADVTNEDGISQAIKEAEAVAGTIDILIANAGTLEVSKLESHSPTTARRLLDINIVGTLNTVQAALPKMKIKSDKPGSDGFRAIVFVGALESFIPTFEHGVYAASKYAVRALAETLHIELAPYPHIRVSLFCPSRARTNLQAVEESSSYSAVMRAGLGKRGAVTYQSPEKIVAEGIRSVKLGRFAITTRWGAYWFRVLGFGAMTQPSLFALVVEGILMAVFRILSVIFVVPAWRKGVVKVRSENGDEMVGKPFAHESQV